MKTGKISALGLLFFLPLSHGVLADTTSVDETLLNRYVKGRVFVEQVVGDHSDTRCLACTAQSVIEFDTQTPTAMYSVPGEENGYTSIYKYENQTIRLNGVLFHIKADGSQVALESETGVVFLSN
ncbi:hypothetical protein NMR73_002989 [Vibrio navarrensis]|nr:hypothetical protein [Vibrio navarrensis]EJL6564956.1 hypothetical protein [Vibrio navarrensis]